jgi:hypothetical protein
MAFWRFQEQMVSPDAHENLVESVYELTDSE